MSGGCTLVMRSARSTSTISSVRKAAVRTQTCRCAVLCWTVVFRGTLDFVQGARGSVGKEDEEVTILSPHARNRSVPLMLSHEGDVDGHHAVSIGRMDEDKLFYLMSRGLDERAAQQLIVEASFEPVLARIESDELRTEIGSYLERRLLGGTQE